MHKGHVSRLANWFVRTELKIIILRPEKKNHKLKGEGEKKAYKK